MSKETFAFICTTIMPLFFLTIPLSSELQGIDTGMVSYDGIVYASLETGVAIGIATIEVSTRAGKFT